jgi:hypothetical protein
MYVGAFEAENHILATRSHSEIEVISVERHRVGTSGRVG